MLIDALPDHPEFARNGPAKSWLVISADFAVFSGRWIRNLTLLRFGWLQDMFWKISIAIWNHSGAIRFCPDLRENFMANSSDLRLDRFYVSFASDRVKRISENHFNVRWMGEGEEKVLTARAQKLQVRQALHIPWILEILQTSQWTFHVSGVIANDLLKRSSNVLTSRSQQAHLRVWVPGNIQNIAQRYISNIIRILVWRDGFHRKPGRIEMICPVVSLKSFEGYCESSSMSPKHHEIYYYGNLWDDMAQNMGFEIWGSENWRPMSNFFPR